MRRMAAKSVWKAWGSILTLCALCAMLGGFSEPVPAAGARAETPNIIFIMADDLGYGDVGCYGATKVRTPNIDRIAREGMRFTDAHTPSSVCSPTRYGILTGRYCWRTRLKKHVCQVNEPLLIELGRMTVASLLKSAGYRTACVGKWHLGFGEKGPDWNGELKPGPLEVGFDYFFGVPTTNNWPPFVFIENHRVVGKEADEVIKLGGGTSETYDPHANPGMPVIFMNSAVMDEEHLAERKKWVKEREIAATRDEEDVALVQTAKAVEFIRKNRSHPFFLYFATTNIHIPLTPNRKFKGSSEIGIRGDFIHELDWAVGEVLKTLDELGLTEKTFIVFTSDNGGHPFNTTPQGEEIDQTDNGHRCNGPWRGLKGDIWEAGHRVPFVARWPGKIPAGTTSDELICLTDLMASAASIVERDLPKDAGEDSINILPALLGQKRAKPLREALVHHSANGMFAIRQENWKLIEGVGAGWQNLKPASGEPPGQLYDLAKDPVESNNLYKQRPDIVARLEALLEKYKREGRSRP